jgi:hypothetical protein
MVVLGLPPCAILFDKAIRLHSQGSSDSNRKKIAFANGPSYSAKVLANHGSGTAPMPSLVWSDQAFVSRVKQRVSQLGMTMSQYLQLAKVSHDTLDKNPRSRNIDTLIRLAEPLRWGLPEIMGLAVPRMSPEMLKTAFTVAHQGLRQVDYTEDALIEVAADIYNHLTDLEREGIAINDGITRSLALRIASEWQKKS